MCLYDFPCAQIKVSLLLYFYVVMIFHMLKLFLIGSDTWIYLTPDVEEHAGEDEAEQPIKDPYLTSSETTKEQRGLLLFAVNNSFFLSAIISDMKLVIFRILDSPFVELGGCTA